MKNEEDLNILIEKVFADDNIDDAFVKLSRDQGYENGCRKGFLDGYYDADSVIWSYGPGNTQFLVKQHTIFVIYDRARMAYNETYCLKLYTSLIEKANSLNKCNEFCICKILINYKSAFIFCYACKYHDGACDFIGNNLDQMIFKMMAKHSLSEKDLESEKKIISKEFDLLFFVMVRNNKIKKLFEEKYTKYTFIVKDIT